MHRLVARLPVVLAAVACGCGLSATHASAAAPITDPLPAIAAPAPATGATTAGIVQSVEALSRPGGGRKVWRIGTQTTWSAEPTILLVLGSATYNGQQWLRVLLPIRPDGTSGWIPRNYADLMHTPYWISVDTATRSVAVDLNGRTIHRYRAVVGKPSTPTPDGLAAIYEKDAQSDPTAFLGPWALPLTILSNVLYNFGGGPGRVAIHGRDGASLLNPLGTAASHGCIRIDNAPITWMAHHIPAGTPVMITS